MCRASQSRSNDTKLASGTTDKVLQRSSKCETEEESTDGGPIKAFPVKKKKVKVLRERSISEGCRDIERRSRMRPIDFFKDFIVSGEG